MKECIKKKSQVHYVHFGSKWNREYIVSKTVHRAFQKFPYFGDWTNWVLKSAYVHAEVGVFYSFLSKTEIIVALQKSTGTEFNANFIEPGEFPP